jgi:hypothetical protein
MEYMIVIISIISSIIGVNEIIGEYECGFTSNGSSFEKYLERSRNAMTKYVSY